MYFLAILVKDRSKFSNFLPRNPKIVVISVILVHRKGKFGNFCLENGNSWHFDVEFNLVLPRVQFREGLKSLKNFANN